MMKFRLIPRNEKFYVLFEKHCSNLEAISHLLLRIMEAKILDPRWAQSINEAEQEADMITHDIMKDLQKEFIVPFDREDIYELAKRVDDVIDFVEDAVVRIVDYRLIGDSGLNEFLTHVREALARLTEGLAMLREIATSEKFDRTMALMSDCEHAADRLIRKIIAGSDHVNVAELVGKADTEFLTIHDFQKAMGCYSYLHRRREIAEIFEKAVDACKHVFHTLGNIRTKYA